MILKSLKLTVMFSFFICHAVVGSINAQQNIRSPLVEGESEKISNTIYSGPGMNLVSSYFYGPDYIIGPEIPVTGLTGFYDWQSNGPCMHQLAYVNNSVVHAIFTLAYDSLNASASRRTGCAFSNNAGANWTFLGHVPNIRSGFSTLTQGITGPSAQVAIIANHYLSGTELTTGIHVDLIPGGGTFTTTTWNFNTTNFIWPQIATFTNGTILVGAQTYQQSIGTDTGIIQLFNPNTHSWVGNPRKLVSPADQSSMRIATATGPSGKGIYVLDAVFDTGGGGGGNRIFYWVTGDNGQTWSGPTLLWSSYLDSSGVLVSSWGGLDAIYDDEGNFYVAFNTYGDSLRHSKIWVTKNGGPAVLVAKNSQIPGAAWVFTISQAFVCSMDWPSLCITNDGQFILCAYSVLKQNDIVNGYQAFDLYYSFSQTSNLNFYGYGPIQITSGTNDERYVSLNRRTIGTPIRCILPFVYQKDPQPGSSAIESAPLSRASLIFRDIFYAITFENTENKGSEIPAAFSLYQNYPNPFNPVTKIKFDIPSKGEGQWVRLIIYDVLGREVATLVNELLKPGTDVVEFDGTNYPSGVYFYKLITADFAETKSMVLLK